MGQQCSEVGLVGFPADGEPALASLHSVRARECPRASTLRRSCLDSHWPTRAGRVYNAVVVETLAARAPGWTLSSLASWEWAARSIVMNLFDIIMQLVLAILNLVFFFL